MSNELAIRPFEDMTEVKQALGSAMMTMQYDDPLDLINLVNGTANDFADIINKPTWFVDFMFQESTIVDDATGEIANVIKTLVITEDGTLYAGISSGLLKCFKTAITVIKEDFANWEYQCLIKQEKVKRGNMYTCEMLARRPKGNKKTK